MDALKREDARSRERIALASAMQLRVITMIDLTVKPPDAQQLLVDRVILPFVAFGPVLVAQLASFEKLEDHASSLPRDLLYARDKGLCHDFREVFPDQEMNAARKSYLDDPANQQFYQAFAETDFWYCAATTELFIRGKYPDEQTDQEWEKVWRDNIGRISSRYGMGNYAIVEPPVRVRAVETGELLSFYRQTMARKYAYNLEVDRHALIALGKKPTATHLEYDLPSFGQAVPEMRVIEVAVPNIAIPRLQNVRDLIDFAARDEYTGPMRRLRGHVSDLIGSRKSTLEISQEIAEDMHRLDRTIKKEQLDRYFGVCKFVFGSVFGAIEDVVKLRLESLVKRPFEIAEKITEQFYYGPAYEEDPLYVLWKLKDEFGSN